MKWKNINFAIVDQSLISGVNFLLSVILARIMPSNEFGLYVFAFSILVLSVGLMNNAICSPLSVLGASSDCEEWDRLLFNSFIVFLGVSILLILGFGISCLYLKRGLYSSNGRILGSIGLIVALYLGQEFARRVLLTRLRTTEALLVDLITYGSRIALIVIFLYQGCISCSLVVYVFGFTSFLGVLFGGRLIGISFLRKNRGIEKNVLRKIWDYGKWTLADWLPFVLSGHLYIYVVTFVLGNAANGVLGACRNLIAPVTILLVGVMNFALPYYANIYNKQGHEVLLTSLKWFFLILIVGVLAYLVIINIFAEHILSLLFGKYEGYSHLVLLFSIGIFVNFFFKAADVYLKVTLKPKLVFLSRGFAAFASVSLCYPLIANFGMKGAVSSYIISQVTMCVSLYHFALISKRGITHMDIMI